MNEQTWTAVDHYLADLFVPRDEALEGALRASDAAGMPAIHVSPTQGKLLYLLARMAGAKNILEIGTLAGYSTLWLARALPPDGKVVTLELEPRHAEVARSNLARARCADRVELIVGKAADSLEALHRDRRGPFDFIFIDADKARYAQYLTGSLKLSRPGTVIVADNVVRKGRVLDDQSDDVNVRGVRRFNDALAKLPNVEVTTIQTVGSKGYDGFALIRVTK